MLSDRTYKGTLLKLSSLLALSMGCGDCTCSGTPVSKDTTEITDTNQASYAEENLEQIEQRMMAMLRIQDLALVESSTKAFISPKGDADRVQLERELSFHQILVDYLGEETLSSLRKTGSVDIGWIQSKGKQTLGQTKAEWFIVLPVESRDEFLKRKDVEDIDKDFSRLNASKSQLWVLKAKPEYIRGRTSDKGDKIVIGSSSAAALHAMDIVNKYGRELAVHAHVAVWPSHIGLTQRWDDFDQELSQRLATAGHGLLPARAGMVNLEIYALQQLARNSNWPEPIQLQFEYKIRDGKPKMIRTSAFVESPDEGFDRLKKLHEAMQPRKGGYPPVPAAPGTATLKLRLDRSELDDTFDLVMPEHARYMLAAKGEESMTSLRGLLSDLLDHNRGATTFSFFPQKHDLSAETFIAFEASDLEGLPNHALKFNEELVKSFWAPLHLVQPADISKVETVKLKKHPKLDTHKLTFEVITAEQPIELGMCWTIFDGQYLSYLGEDACEKLDAQISEKPAAQPATLVLNANLTDLVNMFYLPPGRKLREPIGKDKPHNFTINGYARPFEGKNQFIFETQVKDSRVIRDLLNTMDTFSDLWNPNRELELTDMLQRVSLEQALYQEPAFSFIGSPGLATGAPPAMFFGIPFSLPPAPPNQLKEAFTGKPVQPPQPKRVQDDTK